MLTENHDGNAHRLAWSLREAALSCGVSVAYLRKVIDKGEIKPTRLGRRVLITDFELKRWLGLDNAAENSEEAAA